jgi:hypothetical protein
LYIQLLKKRASVKKCKNLDIALGFNKNRVLVTISQEVSSPTPNLGIDILLDNFLFVNFSDVEVIRLFENISFSLDSQDDIKINIVNKFRILLKSRFNKIIKDI